MSQVAIPTTEAPTGAFTAATVLWAKESGNTRAPQPSCSPTRPMPTNPIIETILSRSAAKYYDPTATLSDDQIRNLVRIGTSAPTSFHLQNWRFIAVRTPEAKAHLHPIAWNQPAITESQPKQAPR
jgi:hypothetical protein